MTDRERPQSDTEHEAQTKHQRYAHPSNGRLTPLVVQSFEDPRLLPKTSQWTRMGKPASRVPSFLKVTYWIGSSTIGEGGDKRVYTPASIGAALAKLIGASPAMYLLMSGWDWGIPTSAHQSNLKFEPDLRYSRVYCGDPVFSTHVRITQPRASPLPREENWNTQGSSFLGSINLESNLPPPRRMGTDLSGPWISRTESSALSLRPRYLCLVKDFDERTYETVQVSEYISSHGEQVDMEFVFVSYTRMQFRVATDAEIDTYDYSDERTREANRQVARNDRETLIRWGIDAARAVEKQAFWLDFECVRDADGLARSTSSSEDVYRICDIVRASHSMVIGIGSPADDRVMALLSGESLPEYLPDSTTNWLHQWGSRLWTLPELLLCPSEYRIKLYVAGGTDEPRELAKRNFAERAWDDAESVKDLVNHYEGSAILTPLQLTVAALECFARRKTDQFSPGDIAYAIMGLLPDRQRPEVKQEDSGFQAFARLSLAHDDGGFLERLICLLPLRKGSQWFETDDLWGTRLKDINPLCQLVEVGDSDSILLENAYGATIHWDGIDGTASLNLINEFAMATLISGVGLSVILPKMWLGMMFFVETMSHRSNGFQTNLLMGISYLTLAIPFIYALVGPLLILRKVQKPRKPTKAELIGIEGFVDVATVERYLWGYPWGRMTLTSNIPLYHDEDGEPLYEETDNEGYAFTLVDTNSLTVSHFRASRPPVAMFICGQEGGMKRAILCSYHCETNTYCRETVLRVAHQVLEQMRRVDRFRLALEFPSRAEPDGDDRQPGSSRDSEVAEPEATNGADVQVLDDGRYFWKPNFVFILITLISVKAYSGFERHIDVGTISYSIGFLVAQVLAHVLITYVPVIRMVSSISLLKGFVFCFRDFKLRGFSTPWHLSILTPLSGLVDGMLLPMFVVFVWSWYPAHQAPTRMLVWSSLGAIAFTFIEMAIGALISVRLATYVELCAYPMVCFYLSIGGSDLVGLPNEVPWLDAPRRVLYSCRAATCKYSEGTGLVESSLKDALLSSPQPLIFFIISLLNSMVVEVSVNPLGVIDGLISALMLVVVSFLSFKALRFTPAVAVMSILVSVIGSTIYHLTPSIEVAIGLVRTQTFVLPLLWAYIVHCTSTRSEGLWCLSLSLVGVALGRLILVPREAAVMVPLAALEAAVIGLIWFWDYRKETKAIRGMRASSVGEEYRDEL